MRAFHRWLRGFSYRGGCVSSEEIFGNNPFPRRRSKRHARGRRSLRDRPGATVPQGNIVNVFLTTAAGITCAFERRIFQFGQKILY